MQLNQAAAQRLMESKSSGKGIHELFKYLVVAAEMHGGEVSLVIGYQGKEDKIEDGDLIPTITLSLSPPTNFEEQHESDGNTEESAGLDRATGPGDGGATGE